jgi:formate hydrogenlyase subunit 4
MRKELQEALDAVKSLVMFLKKRQETVPHSTSVLFATLTYTMFFSLIINVVNVQFLPDRQELLVMLLLVSDIALFGKCSCSATDKLENLSLFFLEIPIRILRVRAKE